MTNRESAAKMRARGLSLREIAEALGMSREGARQLLLPLRPRVCPGCGKPMPSVAGKPRYCRAPCLPPSEYVPKKRRSNEFVGPPRRRGRPRNWRERPGGEMKKGKGATG
jgi:hypothetical protein